jgi:hypothetical protein
VVALLPIIDLFHQDFTDILFLVEEPEKGKGRENDEDGNTSRSSDATDSDGSGSDDR